MPRRQRISRPPFGRTWGFAFRRGRGGAQLEPKPLDANQTAVETGYNPPVSWRLKSCPRCGGDLYSEDGYAASWSCLQCGYHDYPDSPPPVGTLHRRRQRPVGGDQSQASATVTLAVEGLGVPRRVLDIPEVEVIMATPPVPIAHSLRAAVALPQDF